jgi:hypothetical protein
MARTVVPLTDSKIKSAKPIKKDGIYKEYILSDGNGLHLLIKPNGKKLWEFKYKSPTLLKPRKTSMGNYPQTTLKIAREIRAKYQELLSQGIDIIDNKKRLEDEIKSKRNGMFPDVTLEWLAKESQRTTEDTQKGKLRVFTKDVIPFVRKKHISDVTIDDIIMILETRLLAKLKIKHSFLYQN